MNSNIYPLLGAYYRLINLHNYCINLIEFYKIDIIIPLRGKSSWRLSYMTKA